MLRLLPTDPGYHAWAAAVSAFLREFRAALRACDNFEEEDEERMMQAIPVRPEAAPNPFLGLLPAVAQGEDDDEEDDDE